jgi:hypothetical protein
MSTINEVCSQTQTCCTKVVDTDDVEDALAAFGIDSDALPGDTIVGEGCSPPGAKSSW